MGFLGLWENAWDMKKDAMWLQGGNGRSARHSLQRKLKKYHCTQGQSLQGKGEEIGPTAQAEVWTAPVL
jgi:hypothetical protein